MVPGIGMQSCHIAVELSCKFWSLCLGFIVEQLGRVLHYAMSGASTTTATAAGTRKLNLFYTQLHDRNLGSFRLLVDSVLPVRYPEDIYKKLVATPHDFTKLGES